MQAYAIAYRGSYTDTFYFTEQHGFANATEYNNMINDEKMEKVVMNLCFLMGKINSEINFNFILNSKMEIVISEIEII